MFDSGFTVQFVRPNPIRSYAGNNYDIKILSTVDEIVRDNRFATGLQQRISKHFSNQNPTSSKNLISQSASDYLMLLVQNSTLRKSLLQFKVRK